MGLVTYCTLCLVTDVKIYNMNSIMFKAYNELIQTHHKMSIDQMQACFECAHLLHKYKEFKEKCLSAYNLLQLYSDDFKITEENLRKIDRNQNNLASKLSECYDTYQIMINETDYQESVNKSKIKTESVLNCRKRITPLRHRENNENAQVNPLEIDGKQIKIEIDELTNNDESANVTEIKKFDTTVEGFKIELEVENMDDCDIGKDSNSSESSSEEDDDDDDKDWKCNVRKSTRNVKKSISIKNIDEEDDKDSDIELKQLIDKYPLLDRYNVETEEKEQKLLPKRKLKKEIDTNAILPKKRRKKREVVSSVRETISELIKVKSATKIIKKGNGKTIDRSFFENNATIIDMTPEDAMRELLLRKETVNYKLCKYKCEFCYRGYNLEATYQGHMKKHSAEEGPITCAICQLRFLGKPALCSHMKACHTYKFICLKCPYICFSLTQMKNHIFLHKGKQYACKECGEKFKYPHSVLSHKRIKHKLEEVCDLCGNVYGAEKGLLAHKRRIHRTEKNEFQGPKCDECNVHFSNEKAWKRHLVLCTRHKVSNGCEICGESFDNVSSLREHSKTHEKKKCDHYRKPVDPEYYKAYRQKLLGPCVYCAVPLETTRQYNVHMSKYHPESEQAKKILHQMSNKCVCEVCGMMFKLPCFLKIHLRSHTGEKPYACGKCDKRFALKYTLQSHQATHADESPYKCHICGKGYCNKSSLTKHIKYHTERPFQCSSCDKTFTFLYEMNNHIKYVHNKVPWPKRDRTQRDMVKKRQL